MRGVSRRHPVPFARSQNNTPCQRGRSAHLNILHERLGPLPHTFWAASDHSRPHHTAVSVSVSHTSNLTSSGAIHAILRQQQLPAHSGNGGLLALRRTSRDLDVTKKLIGNPHLAFLWKAWCLPVLSWELGSDGVVEPDLELDTIYTLPKHKTGLYTSSGKLALIFAD